MVTLGEQVGYFLPCSILPEPAKGVESQGPAVPHVNPINAPQDAPPAGSRDAPIFVPSSAPTPPRLGTQARPVIVPATPRIVSQPTYQRGICIRGRPSAAPCRFIRPQNRRPPTPSPSTPTNKPQRINPIPFPNGYNSNEEELEAELRADKARMEERTRAEAEKRHRELASIRRYLAIEEAIKGKLKRPQPRIERFNLSPSATATSSVLSQSSLGSPFSTPCKKSATTKANLQLVASPSPSWDGQDLLDQTASSDEEFYEARSDIDG
ncbi:hypothetical protein CPC08DRAFT_731525 [Agrocybe pediades]|nr:hypothetical protein CPC08DRAFT_731525 [Agrocybe pediades]